MKKILILIFCLALMSLACLQTTVVAQNVSVTASPTFVKVQVPVIVTVTLTPALCLKGEGATCARVIAIEALNVRFGASDKDVVFAWLKSGELVQVLDQSDSNWWFIEHDGFSGYVRSSYLEEVECE